MTTTVGDAMPRTDPRPSVVVVGAGISGLTAAHRLVTAGCRVTVLEAGDAIGGRMSSHHHDGWTINRAANILPSSYHAIVELVTELGLDDRVTAVPGALAIPRDGRLHRIRSAGPGMVLDGARTGLLGPASKARLARVAADAVRMRSRLSYANLGEAARFDTMTAAEYCDRHLDPDLYDYLVDPIVRALFTTEADRVSVVDFFFAAVNFVGAGFLRYGGGVGFLPEALAHRLDVRTATRVTAVEETADGVLVDWQDASGAGRTEADAAVVATTAGEAARLCPGLAPPLRDILQHRIEYGTTLVGHHALRRPPDTDAMVIPVPRPVHPHLCVVTNDHVISPSAAPPGAGLVSTYWVDSWSRQHRDTDDAELAALMTTGLDTVLPGAAADVEFTTIDRWSPSVVLSRPGCYATVAELAVALTGQRRLQFAGDYLTASSTNGCVVSGERAAARIRAVLGIPQDR